MDNVGGDPGPHRDHRPGHGGHLALVRDILLPQPGQRGRHQHGQWCLPEHCLWPRRQTALQIYRSCRVGIGKFDQNIFHFPQNILLRV